MAPARGANISLTDCEDCSAPLACRAQTHPGFQPPIARIYVSRLEHRPARLAEVRLLPPQAGDDGPDVRDFAGAKTIDIGCAGFLLFRRCCCRERRAGCG